MLRALSSVPARKAMDFAAGRTQAHQPLPVANEKLDLELALEQLQLPAQTGLGHVQRCGGARDVEIVFHHFAEVAQLLKGHTVNP